MEDLEFTPSIRTQVEKYLIHWKWFALAAFLALFISFIYLRYYATPIYSVSSTILVKDKKTASGLSELSAFEDLSLLGNNTNSVENEIEILRSKSLMGKVVDKLGLDVSIYAVGRVRVTETFGEKNSLLISFFKNDTTQLNIPVEYDITINSPEKFTITN